MGCTIAGVGDQAVRAATGKGWADWFVILDAAGGTEIDHRDRVAMLADAGLDQGWWQQKVAVGYEHERGLREAGETGDAGYEIGVQRTVGVPRMLVWAQLVSTAGLDTWLGPDVEVAIEPGATFTAADDTAGEIRTVAPGERIRVRWQPPDRNQPTTVQITLTPSPAADDRTAVRIHQEGLADGDERERMRTHWKAVLEELEALLANDSTP